MSYVLSGDISVPPYTACFHLLLRHPHNIHNIIFFHSAKFTSHIDLIMSFYVIFSPLITLLYPFYKTRNLLMTLCHCYTILLILRSICMRFFHINLESFFRRAIRRILTFSTLNQAIVVSAASLASSTFTLTTGYE